MLRLYVWPYLPPSCLWVDGSELKVIRLETCKRHKSAWPVGFELDVVCRFVMLMAERADVPGFVGTIHLDDMGAISRHAAAP